jgi:peptide/nickel transport system substrate-binding protein
MNNKVAPLNNVDVRQAVSLALDRQAFNASQEGLCTPVGQAFPQGMVGYVQSLTPTTNVAQAKSLVQAAGATGATIKLISIGIEPFATFAKLIQAQLGNIGLTVQIETEPTSTFRTLYAQGSTGMLMAQATVTSPDPTGVISLYVLGSNNPGTKDPTLVAEINQAEQLSLGTPQRATAFQNINRDLTTKDLIWAPICTGANIFVANKKMIGLGSMPNAEFAQTADNDYLQIAK